MILINTIRDHAYKIGCGRLLFSHGALNRLGTEVAALGQHPLVLCGEHAFQAVGALIQEQLQQNIITTGMVSGIARGMYQAAMAHAFYEVIRTLFPHDSKPWLHGEIVGVGLRLQELYAENLPEAEQLTAFMRELNMPFSLADLSVPVRSDILQMIASTSPLPDFYIKPETDKEKVTNILHNL